MTMLMHRRSMFARAARFFAGLGLVGAVGRAVAESPAAEVPKVPGPTPAPGLINGGVRSPDLMFFRAGDVDDRPTRPPGATALFLTRDGRTLEVAVALTTPTRWGCDPRASDTRWTALRIGPVVVVLNVRELGS